MKKILAMILCVLLLMPTTLAFADGTMKDGTYAASANGMDGLVQIEVTIKDDKITDIVIVDDNETAGVGTNALAILPTAVIDTQSLAVDSVSGATISSAAFKMAVADAITQAGGDAAEWRNREIPVREEASV